MIQSLNENVTSLVHGSRERGKVLASSFERLCWSLKKSTWDSKVPKTSGSYLQATDFASEYLCEQATRPFVIYSFVCGWYARRSSGQLGVLQDCESLKLIRINRGHDPNTWFRSLQHWAYQSDWLRRKTMFWKYLSEFISVNCCILQMTSLQSPKFI